jgi:glutamyl-tRNA(Gln) amidotransferase subunit E
MRLRADFNPRSDPPLDFPERDLTEMTPQDYDALGFMCGLEVHQQLETTSKLFCRCPAGHSVAAFDAEVLRHMRPTLSELGEYDGTALMEFKTRKDIVYRLERGTVCTYEMDDTPPFELDDEAVQIALELCLMFDLNLVSELHVMRKQYLDGSIPTGFQRTIMMGLDGAVPFRVPELGVDKPLRIRQLSLEEDSCREVSDVGHRITFRTDRLGVPLTEVVTEPDLLTPWEAQAGARLVARATRAVGLVRRGPGAARQDVNVSIAGGRRIEIKGVHHHRGLPRLVHVEAFRQLNLLRIRDELHQRGVTHESLLIPGGVPWEVSPLVADATAILKRSEYAPLRETLEQTNEHRHGLEHHVSQARQRSRNSMVCAVRLPGFAGILARPTQPGVTFANELADRVRVIACLTARPFMIHSDIKGYGLSNAEWRQLRSTLQADRGDSIVVVWGPREDCATAARELFLRASEALDGIPAETRQAYRDGTNGFERILPGPDRMYPDTDTPPLPVPDAWIERARQQLPERPWERANRYCALGLGEHEAARLVDAPWASLFDDVVAAAGLASRRDSATARVPDPVVRRLFYALERQLPAFLRRNTGSRRRDIAAVERRSAHEASAPAFPPAEPIAALVRSIDSGGVCFEALDLGLEHVLANPRVDAKALVETFQARAEDEQRAAELVQRCALEASTHVRPGLAPAAVVRWAMGEVMPALRGRLAANDVRALLANALPQVPQAQGVSDS